MKSATRQGHKLNGAMNTKYDFNLKELAFGNTLNSIPAPKEALHDLSSDSIGRIVKT